MNFLTATIQVEVDSSKVNPALQQVKGQVTTNISNVQKTVNSLNFMGLVTKVTALGYSVVKVAKLFNSFGLAASDNAWTMMKFNKVVTEGNKDLLDWVSSSAKTWQMNESSLLGYTTQLYMTVRNIGATSDASAKLSQQMTTLAVDMAAFANVPVAEAIHDVQFALEGNYRGLRKYGISISETDIKMEALRQGYGLTVNSLTALQKEQLASNILLREASVVTGMATEKTKTFRGSVDELKASYEGFKESLGKSVAGQRVYGALSDWFNMWPELDKARTSALNSQIKQLAIQKRINMSIDEARQLRLAESAAALEQVKILELSKDYVAFGKVKQNIFSESGYQTASEQLKVLRSRVEGYGLAWVKAEQAMKDATNVEDFKARQDEALAYYTSWTKGQKEFYEQDKALQQDRADSTVQMYSTMNNCAGEYIKAEKSRLDIQAQDYRDLGLKETDINNWRKQQLQELSAAYYTNYTAMGKIVDAAGKGMESSMSSALQGMMEGTMTFSQGFAGIMRGIVQSVNQSVAQMIAQWLRWQIFSSLGGMGGATGGMFGVLAGTNPFAASVKHSGGIVGESGPTRRVNSEIFVGAPRLHRGLSADEVPSILQKGEQVIPKGESGKVTHNTFNINATDAASFVQLLSRNKNALTSLVQSAMRDNHPLRRSFD